MYKRYRIMVRGEDNTEFCYINSITEDMVDRKMMSCKEDYPCAMRIWLEDEGAAFAEAQARLDDDTYAMFEGD